MAFSLNKVMLIGNLGADAETRFTTNNVSVTTFPLATTRSYKNQNNEWVNETTWHQIVCYNLSDFYKEALKKGKKFYVEGRINKREYTKGDVKRYITEIIAEQIIPLDPKDQTEQDSTNSSENISRQIENNVNLQENGASEDLNDDLPF